MVGWLVAGTDVSFVSLVVRLGVLFWCALLVLFLLFFLAAPHSLSLSHTHTHTPTPQDGLDTADKCEILAFATVMLNTDRYNPAIKQKKKMTNTQFKNNMRGMGVSNDFLDIVRPRLTSTKYLNGTRCNV